MDSSQRIVSSMQYAAQQLNLPVPDTQAVRNIIGLSLANANKILIPNITDADNSRLTAAYSHHYRDLNQVETPLYDGVRQTLEQLHSKGYKLAVATGKSRKGVDRVLDETGLGDLFHYSRGADETKSKPDPLMLAQLISQADVELERALMIGDTSYDLEMAQNIGMSSIGVSYGMHSVELLNTFNPVKIVDQFKQIEDWLNKQSESISE